jgi:hypothetical protein
MTDDFAPKTARLYLRLSPAALAHLRRAADLRQQDLTSFVLGAALDRASEVSTAERLAVERRAREQAPRPEPDEVPYPVIVRDPSDPDDDLWDDERVTREPLDLQPLVVETLRANRQQARQPAATQARRDPGRQPEAVAGLRVRM